MKLGSVNVHFVSFRIKCAFIRGVGHTVYQLFVGCDLSFNLQGENLGGGICNFFLNEIEMFILSFSDRSAFTCVSLNRAVLKNLHD